MDENEVWNIYENQRSEFTFNTVATSLAQTSSPYKPGQGGIVVMHEAPKPICFDSVYRGTADIEDTDIAPTITAGGGGQPPAAAISEPFAAFSPTMGSQDIGPCRGDVSPTILVGSSSSATPPAIAIEDTRTIVRRLTPLECERLMGWEDGWTEWGINDAGERIEIAATNRYRICGNGIVGNVTEWIGRRLP